MVGMACMASMTFRTFTTFAISVPYMPDIHKSQGLMAYLTEEAEKTTVGDRDFFLHVPLGQNMMAYQKSASWDTCGPI